MGGGVKGWESVSSDHGDIFYLDLKKLDQWRESPYIISGKAEKYEYYQIADNDKAYLFNGSLRLDFFDLKTEKWASMRNTTLTGPSAGPYDSAPLLGYSMQLANGNLYIYMWGSPTGVLYWK